MTYKLLIAAILVVGVATTNYALAAPHTVTQKGTPVTGAVPGKLFNLKLQVKNTGSEAYSNVKVAIHIPDGINHASVLPADAQFQDDTIFWTNVPLEASQTFNPTLTLSLEAGTALKTKKNIWVEVTGTDMEATSVNFSITAVSTAKQVVTTLTSADITSMFQIIYKRTPTASELTYWLSRRADKPSRGALQGAMAYHRAQNIQH